MACAILFQEKDIDISVVLQGHLTRLNILPDIFRDSYTVFAANVHGLITVESLISIFKLKVWCVFAVMVFVFNFCFMLCNDESPSIQQNPRVKSKNMSPILRLVTFDSFISFQSKNSIVYYQDIIFLFNCT